MSADLAADTAVRADPATPGRYHATLPDHWDFLLPSGGVVMTCALRAAAAALGDPALRFASATTMFCTPIKHGPLVADVVVLRRGKSTAQLRVALRDGSGEPGLEVLATDADVWDDEGRYLAHGAQAMYLRGVAGEPPVIDASER
jgi:acyl-coenzyme A thioesterase PaaI-like protein